jgi:hypothetical protein
VILLSLKDGEFKSIKSVIFEIALEIGPETICVHSLLTKSHYSLLIKINYKVITEKKNLKNIYFNKVIHALNSIQNLRLSEKR